MLFTKNLKNIKFKKKLFYKFTSFFKVIDVVNAQIYYVKSFKTMKNSFCFSYVFVKALS